MWKSKEELCSGWAPWRGMETPASRSAGPEPQQSWQAQRYSATSNLCLQCQGLSSELTAICPRALLVKCAYNQATPLLCSIATLPPTLQDWVFPVAKSSAFQETSIPSWAARDIATLRYCTSEQLKAHGLESEAPGLERRAKESMWDVVPASMKVILWVMQ